MIGNLSPSNEAFMASMDRVQRTVSDAILQTSSGKRVNMASDAPDAIDAILQLRTDEVHNSQIQSNLGVAQADANAADTALASATQLMDRATVLAAQRANFTVDATGRLENSTGGSFAVSQSAQDIFDSRNPDDTLASGNVFAALNNLPLARVS